MVGVSAGQVLVVPPLDCAWLTETGYIIEEQECRSIDNILTFEAKGSNDVTILLKTQYGSRRVSAVEGVVSSPRAQASSVGSPCGIGGGYTVIIGSHRNSCVKIEKNGATVACVGYQQQQGQQKGQPGMHLLDGVFQPFWVSYNCSTGEIWVGHGHVESNEEDGCDPRRNVCCRWKDDDPIEHIRYIGLSSWDSHIGYRNIHLRKRLECRVESDVECGVDDRDDVMMMDALQMVGPAQVGNGPAWEDTLSRLCLRTLKNECISIASVCGILRALDDMAVFLEADNGVSSGGSFDEMEQSSVAEQCIAFAAAHLRTLYETKEHVKDFCALPAHIIERIVKHQAIPCSEMEVYKAVLMWAGTDDAFTSAGPRTPTKIRSDRFISLRDECGLYKDGADSLLCHVRFPLMTRQELEEIQNSSLHGRSHMLRSLIQEAIEFHESPEIDGRSVLDPSISVNGVVDRVFLSQSGTMRFQQRCPVGCTPLIFMYDGDTNGVCHFIGTKYGTRPWVNPVSTGMISVTASSPASRSGTDPRALVSRSFCRLNFAGERRNIHGTSESWWMIDLGEHHRLRCTRYCLRHDGSADFLRDWCLQGSSDGFNWETLILHTNDQTLRMSGQYASWPVRKCGRESQNTHRYFRIFQTVPNAIAPNPTHVSLSNIDLYGDFFFQGSH